MSASPAVSPTQVHNPGNNSTPQHQQDAEFREAYDFWGYLFKQDRTGTDRLKALLTGVKLSIVRKHEPTDCNDVTPSQLAFFYREMYGNYDKLFLDLPHETIAVIYKRLGCLHSLQPQAFTHSTAFTEPTVPALKTEGWVVWQTVQLLLAPDEHAEFLREAVRKWDIKDPATGEIFPKILPRQCFPAEPDKLMVAWYEGVSERLRQEDEAEARKKELEAEKAEVRRIRAKAHDDGHHSDDESTDSRAQALAYFRNPLYRYNEDGRPSIATRNSKRPGISPRPTFVGKGKEAATMMGHVVRNVGSPHLWDGKGSRSASHDRDRRRRSMPDHAHSSADHNGGAAPQTLSAGPTLRHNRSRSSQRDRTNGPSPRDEKHILPEKDLDPGLSPPLVTRPKHSQPSSHEATLRRPRSYEPTPSQKEYGDYFEDYDRVNQDRRKGSAHGSATSPALSGGGGLNVGGGNGVGAGFGPSASPLFATHIARQPPPPQSRRGPSADYGPSPRKSTSHRRPPPRPYSRSPDHHARRRSDGHRSSLRPYDSPRRSHHDRGMGSRNDGNDDDRRPHSRRRSSRPREDDYDYDELGRVPSQGRSRSNSRPRRRDGSDISFSAPDERERDRDYDRDRDRDRDSEHDRDRDRNRDRPPTRVKHTRFGPDPASAVAGVDGRRYPTDAPWR